MPRKLTSAEFHLRVKEKFPQYDLSTFSYEGYDSVSTVICPAHGLFKTRAGLLLRGHGCPECAVDRRRTVRLGADEFVARAAARHENRYTYDLSSYKGTQHWVRVSCPTHGWFSLKANAHLLGQGCRRCAAQRSGARQRMSQEQFLAKSRQVHGDRYDLSRAVYKGSKEPVEILCAKHGPFFPTPNNFFKGSGCPVCGAERSGKGSRLPFSVYIDRFNDVFAGEYTYTGVEYRKGVAYVSALCSTHGAFSMRASDHLKRMGCPLCKMPGKSVASFRLAADSKHDGRYDYSAVTDTSAGVKVPIQCPDHGQFLQRAADHLRGQGCPRCTAGPSRAQQELADWLRTYTPVETEVGVGGRRRLDILLPEHSLGVEYHGLIWHSERFAHDPFNLQSKHSAAAAKGIRVIHIFEDEWADRPDTVKRLLLSSLGHLPKVHARRCAVVQVPVTEALAFLDANHLQGGPGTVGCDYLGLHHAGELVAVMAFSASTSHRGASADPGRVELRRFAATASVRGGASKLFSAFLRDNPQVEQVVSYSDNRLFNGAMYMRLGFAQELVNKPSYYYVTPGQTARRAKATLQRKDLVKLLGESFRADLTEADNAAMAGWYRLFDCGTTRWVWRR